MKRAAPEVGLGTLAWYSLLNAVKGCGNIVLDLEAPPPLFFFLRIPDLLGTSILLLVVFGLISWH